MVDLCMFVCLFVVSKRMSTKRTYIRKYAPKHKYFNTPIGCLNPIECRVKIHPYVCVVSQYMYTYVHLLGWRSL